VAEVELTRVEVGGGFAEAVRRLRPEEWLFLVFTTMLVGLTIYAQAGYTTLAGLAKNWKFLVFVGVVVAAIFMRGFWRAEDGRWRAGMATVGRTLREFSPLWACMIIYETLHDLTPILRPHVVDGSLIAIDHAVLGVDAGRWLNDHIGSPALTEYLVLCYASYGFAIPLFAGWLYFRGRVRAFRDLSLAVTITAFIGYMGYLSVPAIGPYMYQTNVYHDQIPQWGHNAMLSTINHMKGGARDCFPSLHTAMTTVLMTMMWRNGRKGFWVYLPVALGLYLSTLYLRVHYAVDVAAGFVTATIALLLAPRINRWWYARKPLPEFTE
jgi:membrane-associated phospholipid phosphatase